MEPISGKWKNVSEIGHLSYQCGHCNERTGVKIGYPSTVGRYKIYICGGCNRPTYFGNGSSQVPAPIAGKPVEKLPEEIDNLYTLTMSY